jgi:hypothetical protein
VQGPDCKLVYHERKEGRKRERERKKKGKKKEERPKNTVVADQPILQK